MSSINHKKCYCFVLPITWPHKKTTIYFSGLYSTTDHEILLIPVPLVLCYWLKNGHRNTLPSWDVDRLRLRWPRRPRSRHHRRDENQLLWCNWWPRLWDLLLCRSSLRLIFTTSWLACPRAVPPSPERRTQHAPLQKMILGTSSHLHKKNLSPRSQSSPLCTTLAEYLTS